MDRSKFERSPTSPLTMSKIDSSRIAGGYYASPQMSRHLAYVYVIFPSTDNAVCSGSILSSNTILCAAHCFAGSNRRFEVAGTYVRTGRYNDIGTRYPAKFVHVHKDFRLSTFQNDIALIRIVDNFDAPYSTVRLPNSSFELPEKSVLYAAGFGRTSHNGPSSSRALEVKLVYQNYYRCRRTSKFKKWGPKHMICATDPGFPNSGSSDPCRGDSGGPLYLKKGSKMFQQGITSFGKTCAVKGSVVWYTNLKTYTPVIRQYLNGRKYKWREVFAERVRRYEA